jgi:phosphoglycerate dehydrogenase-like enzyme
VAATRAGHWQRRSGWELDGKTLGLIGFGAIGQAVARKALALAMRIVAFDPHVEVATPGVRPVDLPTLLASSDVISLHAPLTPETRNLLDRSAFARMKAGAYLVNTARGGLVDEEALHEALEAGRLAGAALDVFAHEPPSHSPLIGHDRVIATPHFGAHTREATVRTAMLAAENLVRVLRGEACPNVVNRVPPRGWAVTEAP